MELKQRRYSVLIVSAAESFNQSLKPLLPATQYDPVEIQTSVSAAKRVMLEKTYDFIIINAPLPDESGTRFAVDICTEKNTIVLLLVRNELYEEAYDRFVKYGIFTLPKPTSKPIMHQALQWMGSARERLRKMEKKDHVSGSKNGRNPSGQPCKVDFNQSTENVGTRRPSLYRKTSDGSLCLPP